MQELCYSPYIEQNGIILARSDSGEIVVVPPRGQLDLKRASFRELAVVNSGACLALNENDQLVRFTHTRACYEDLITPPSQRYNIVSEGLAKLGEADAQVVGKVPHPAIIATVSSAGKITVLDEKLWMKHCGELPNCYDIGSKDSHPNFEPNF